MLKLISNFTRMIKLYLDLTLNPSRATNHIDQYRSITKYKAN